MEQYSMKVIARICTDFPEKFGIPRQSGLVESLTGRIIFEPEYRNAQAVRETWSPTVRPPRLGGNRRIGVFATRSPFRPNAIGLSSVRIQRVETDTPDGPVIYVSGVDILDGTPIFDIKPYLAYTDSHPDASGGFTASAERKLLKVDFAEELIGRVPLELRGPLIDVLAQDPRPSYQHDSDRVYGMDFAGLKVKFTVDGDSLTVTDVE